MEQPIDFAWIDGRDEAWRKERARYCPAAKTGHREYGADTRWDSGSVPTDFTGSLLF